MRAYIAILFMLFMLTGCYKNLSPEQINALSEMAKIKNTSFCVLAGAQGSGGFFGGEVKGIVCGGTKDKLTIDQLNAGLQGVTIIRPTQ